MQSIDVVSEHNFFCFNCRELQENASGVQCMDADGGVVVWCVSCFMDELQEKDEHIHWEW